MTASPSTPVVIVGGGPTGITAAILLALQGVPSLVIERWEDIYPQPRAVHLDDEVYRILGKLGVADEFAAISRPALGLQIIDSDHQVLARFQRDPNNEPNGYPQANLFDQPDLERILRNRLAELPLATLRSGAEVISLTRQPDTDEITVDVRGELAAISRALLDLHRVDRPHAPAACPLCTALASDAPTPAPPRDSAAEHAPKSSQQRADPNDPRPPP